MSSPVIQNFMRQQGFADEPADACNMHFAGLYFQPRIVFPLILLAILLQSAWLFLALGVVLVWNVLFPSLNPFERAYNRFVAARRGTPGNAPDASGGSRPQPNRRGRPPPTGGWLLAPAFPCDGERPLRSKKSGGPKAAASG